MTHRDDGGVHQLVAILQFGTLDDILFAPRLRQDDELHGVRSLVLTLHGEEWRWQICIALLEEERFYVLEVKSALPVRDHIQKVMLLFDAAVGDLHFGRQVTQFHNTVLLVDNHGLVQGHQLHAVSVGHCFVEGHVASQVVLVDQWARD